MANIEIKPIVSIDSNEAGQLFAEDALTEASGEEQGHSLTPISQTNISPLQTKFIDISNYLRNT